MSARKQAATGRQINAWNRAYTEARDGEPSDSDFGALRRGFMRWKVRIDRLAAALQNPTVATSLKIIDSALSFLAFKDAEDIVGDLQDFVAAIKVAGDPKQLDEIEAREIAADEARRARWAAEEAARTPEQSREHTLEAAVWTVEMLAKTIDGKHVYRGAPLNAADRALVIERVRAALFPVDASLEVSS